jgi:peptide/nickel transport system substrate-binding protein
MRGTSYDLTSAAPTIYGDDNLVKNCREDETKVCPGLAIAWEPNSDFTEWTFTIRQGVKWHDGTPFTVEDAKFWVDLSFFGAKVGDKVRLPATSRTTWGDLQKTEILPGNKLKITLGRPSTIFTDLLTTHYGMLMQHPKHLMGPRIQAGDLNVAPPDIGYVGTGPFKMEEYVKAVIISVRRNENYWEKDSAGRQLPYLDGVDYYIIRDPSAFHAAFRSGRLDAGARGGGFYVNRELMPMYERILGDKVWWGELKGGRAPNMGFNTMVPPFNDLRVRKAIALFIDRESAIKALGGGDGQTTGLYQIEGWSNPDFRSWPGYNPATKDADRAEARRLLAEAGYPNGLKVKMLSQRPLAEQSEWWQGALAPLGIDLELELFEYANFDQQKLTTDWKVNGASVAGVFPEQVEERLTLRSKSPRTNVLHEDAKIADFFSRLARTSVYEERLEIGREMERYVLKDQVYIVKTFVGISRIPFRTYVKGMFVPVVRPPTHVDYATVWLDK